MIGTICVKLKHVWPTICDGRAAWKCFLKSPLAIPISDSPDILTTNFCGIPRAAIQQLRSPSMRICKTCLGGSCIFYESTFIKSKMKSIVVLHNANRKTQFCGLPKVFYYKSSRSSPRPPKEAQETRDNPKNLTQPRQPHATPETRRPPEVPCTPNIPYIPKQAQDHRRSQATPSNSIKTKNKPRKINQTSKSNNQVLERSQCLQLAPIRKACESKLYAKASICQCLHPVQANVTKIYTQTK